jgi:hypothetical protein
VAAVGTGYYSDKGCFHYWGNKDCFGMDLRFGTGCFGRVLRFGRDFGLGCPIGVLVVVVMVDHRCRFCYHHFGCHFGCCFRTSRRIGGLD